MEQPLDLGLQFFCDGLRFFKRGALLSLGDRHRRSATGRQNLKSRQRVPRRCRLGANSDRWRQGLATVHRCCGLRAASRQDGRRPSLTQVGHRLGHCRRSLANGAIHTQHVLVALIKNGNERVPEQRGNQACSGPSGERQQQPMAQLPAD